MNKPKPFPLYLSPEAQAARSAWLTHRCETCARAETMEPDEVCDIEHELYEAYRALKVRDRDAALNS